MGTIGQRITKARQNKNMNQKELALKANIPEGSLSRYENGLRTPKISAVSQIAIALDVSTDYILGVSDDISFKNNRTYEFKEIFEEVKGRFKTGVITFEGEPASQEAINAMLLALEMGMLLAIEKQKNKI